MSTESETETDDAGTDEGDTGDPSNDAGGSPSTGSGTEGPATDPNPASDGDTDDTDDLTDDTNGEDTSSDAPSDGATDPDEPDSTDESDVEGGGSDVDDGGTETDVPADGGSGETGGQPDIPEDTPLMNSGMGSLGGAPRDGLTVRNSNIYATDSGSWLWLGLVENVTNDSTFCRISIDGTAMFDTGREVEFLAGSVAGPAYSPAVDSTVLACLEPGEKGVVSALAQSVLNGVELSQVVGITYGVSAEDWTAAGVTRLDLLTLSGLEISGDTEVSITGSAITGDESLTNVRALVIPTTASGTPLRLFELNVPNLAPGATWDFETPSIDVEFSDQIVYFSYARE